MYQGKARGMCTICLETNRNYMGVRFMRLISKSEYLIVPEGRKFMGLGKIELNLHITQRWCDLQINIHNMSIHLKMTFPLNYEMLEVNFPSRVYGFHLE